MLSSSAWHLKKIVLNYNRNNKEAFIRMLRRFSSREPFKKPRLWSDKGSHVLQSYDIIGGWQRDNDWLLNRVDLNSIKHQSLKGCKDVNEDRIQVTELSSDAIFLGVFDGHGSSFVAEFLKNNLHKYVQKILEPGHCSITIALRRGFIDCDMALSKALENHEENQGSYHRSGSTATVAILKDGKELAIANVGDSRAILCSDGKAQLLTKDHTAFSRDEKNRVLASGGTLEFDSEMTPRVNGRLAMTRCFGNFDLKPYGVIAVPEIRTLCVDQECDSFLALITDGISSVMSTEQTVGLIKSSTIPEESVEILTSSAVQLGSKDDITTVLLPFRCFGTKDSDSEMNQTISFNLTKHI